jgi:hypothetical protein
MSLYVSSAGIKQDHIDQYLWTGFRYLEMPKLIIFMQSGEKDTSFPVWYLMLTQKHEHYWYYMRFLCAKRMMNLIRNASIKRKNAKFENKKEDITIKINYMYSEI